jgi:alpha-beta hydrolase superfamily lysophospholipase
MHNSASPRRCRSLAAAAMFVVLLAVADNAAAQTPFYTAQHAEIVGRPGTVIRQEVIAGPGGATAFRVLYRSTGLSGEPIAVSGVVIVPNTPAPAGGRPVVAWAHPTSGIVPPCAPSLANFKFQQMQGLRELLSRGYVVAATDYPGLGTPGPHPYLVGRSEGHAVLDSIRAAREVAGEATLRRAALWGHSQGGQAVLFAAKLAATYAPETEIVGVAAAAPATELGALLNEDLATPGGKNLLAMTLWSWSRVFNISLDGVVDDAALPVVDRLAQICLESPIDILPRARAGKELQRRFLKVENLTSLEPWRSHLNENTAGVMPARIPVLIIQGAADDTVRPDVTRRYAGSLCASGSRVQLVMMPGVGHGTVAMKGAGSAIGWIAQRFAGLTAPSNCQRGL